MKVTVRALVEADLPSYKALRDAMLEQHPDAFTSDAEADRGRSAGSYRSRLGQAEDGPRFTLGAFIDDTLVGAISCERDERLKVRHVGHIIGMMVSAEARGRGIGRALLRECIARARKCADLEMLTLSVTASNAPAVALYAAEGFVDYGLLRNAIKLGERHYDKALMSLALR